MTLKILFKRKRNVEDYSFKTIFSLVYFFSEVNKTIENW